ncbi:Clp protease N-terminal domain-containing protein, partial [Paenibacillus forsythiae]
MDFNKLTQKLQEAVASAQSLASGAGHQEIDNPHLLKALLEQHEGLLPRLLQKMNVPEGELLRRTDELLRRRPSVG